MFQKDITFDNLFGEGTTTETHYFHLKKSALIEMQMGELKTVYTAKDGTPMVGMAAKLQRITEAEDGDAIMEETKDFIRRSYGKRDGDRFLQSKAIWEEFEQSEAFSQLLWELCMDAEVNAAFMTSVIPGNLDDLAAEVEKAAAQQKMAEALKTGAPKDPTGLTEPTPAPNEDKAPEPAAPEVTRLQQIELATAEKPVTLTNAEVVEIDSDDLKSGLATGRYKLA